ncbi:hypothetical protein J41TS12_22110 [Paenibacillus antibioticophila]|uniref:Uncharacterized protein n=1 Tax=Paenibacillus antibioticophila TaxID=1274374 RepID=A0A919XUZ0_9BACL|nr:hypothetical protein [Paenibacillus antibioticophila]GIO37350.1 hypothetical protein J41TS12_22110 [Paenibacillus antibioticophila]
MKFNIVEASMHKDSEGAFLGKTVFEVEGHKAAYEITFFSKRGKEWDYSLHYAHESGIEAQLMEVDAALEEDDDWFDALLEAAQATLGA